MEISPVLVNLAPGQTSATIEVQNHSGAPAAVQARPYSWTQLQDEDVLKPTQDIILSPPIFTIPEGTSQTVRLLLRGGIKAGEERSYRLLLDEVPPANTGAKQLNISLRVSLPVIAAPAAASEPSKLQWRAERETGGQLVLAAANPGHAYDAVHAIELTLPDGSHRNLVPRGKNPYILPGAERHWIVQGEGVTAGPLHLSVTTEAGKSEQTLAGP